MTMPTQKEMVRELTSDEGAKEEKARALTLYHNQHYREAYLGFIAVTNYYVSLQKKNRESNQPSNIKLLKKLAFSLGYLGLTEIQLAYHKDAILHLESALGAARLLKDLGGSIDISVFADRLEKAKKILALEAKTSNDAKNELNPQDKETLLAARKQLFKLYMELFAEKSAKDKKGEPSDIKFLKKYASIAFHLGAIEKYLKIPLATTHLQIANTLTETIHKTDSKFDPEDLDTLFTRTASGSEGLAILIPLLQRQKIISPSGDSPRKEEEISNSPSKVR